MKKSFAWILVILLSGCAATPQGQENVLAKEVHKSASGKKWTVIQLREDYLRKTGKELKAANTLECGWDGTCFYNRWAAAYDAGLGQFAKENLKKEQEAKAKCISSHECSRNLEISKYSSQLNNSYRLAVYSHPYQQGDYDMAVRTMCEKAYDAQVKSMKLDVLLNNLRDIPGIAPSDREQIVSVADACWNLSRLDYDWKKSLR